NFSLCSIFLLNLPSKILSLNPIRNNPFIPLPLLLYWFMKYVLKVPVMPVYKLTQLPQFKKKNAETTYLIWLTRPRIPYGNASLENFPEESDVATSNAS
ncbi:hypothetical protein P5V15_010050, partial [Pogonomyrmex californicus]